jgi:DNA-binding NarL/FixJ family response regulator
VIRLLIAATSPVLRAGLEALAASSPDLQLIGSFEDVGTAEPLHADVTLAALPLEELAAAGGSAAVVLLAGDTAPPWTSEMLKVGVRAILSQKASAGEILAAIDAAAAGFALIDPRDLEPLLPAAMPLARSGEQPALTAREIDVLRLLAEGAANKTIAWKLAISEHTVKFHVASILARLGASTRTEAVTIGIRKGLIFV